jgi:hypothetical protein
VIGIPLSIQWGDSDLMYELTVWRKTIVERVMIPAHIPGYTENDQA